MADDPNLWQRIFSEQNVLMGFFGALGGSVRAVTLRTKPLESLRVIFVGGATTFSAGTLAPVLLRPYLGESLSEAAVGAISAACFLLGLLAVTLVERAIDKRKEGDNGGP